MNRTILVGRLTKDPELRYTSNGIAVTRFTLAVKRGFKNKHGEKETDFINVVIWCKQAETIANFIGKGHKLRLMGGFRQDIMRMQQANEFIHLKLLRKWSVF